MRELTIVFFFTLLGSFSVSCSGECSGLCGSECERTDCSFDEIVCRRSATTTPEIVINYLRHPEGGLEYTAQIVINVTGIDPVQGHRFEEQAFLDRVDLNHPGGGQEFGSLIGHFCEINRGGDQTDQNMSGKCSFAIKRETITTFMTAKFDCLLEPPPQ